MSGLPRYAPMLAAAGALPVDDGRWAFELKHDGIRALAYVDDRLRLESRNGNDITAAWPELAGLAPANPGFVVDGEVVVEVAGRASFRALAPRMHQRNSATIAGLAETSPATFMIFDLLHIGDRSLTGLPYTQRRELLELTGLAGPHWRIPGLLPGPATDAVAASQALGAEGIICKRRDSWYLAGQRSPAWTKVKNVSHQEVVVIGWKTGTGRRAGTIGSLLVAVPDDRGNLEYAGSVGTGFTAGMLADLHERLAPLQRPDSPVPGFRSTPAGVVWLEPHVVGEVAFTEWTGDGRLRHPSWRGLRLDKDVDEVETPTERP
ncbi:non-homologous end-joining DNA ligase [Nocardia sp. NPDC050378]|uniref:non-homologous end-joining DNA ligase n=1 Tax=Nocardia sp. NPDC050378 TaxID=3155400 RepID=UPI0033FEC0FC